MLIEHALVIHEHQLVPLKGVWIDMNGRPYEARVMHLARTNEGYEIALDGLWGGAIVPIPRVPHFEDARHLDGQTFDDGVIHYGSLSVVVDHFRNDPLEWLEDAKVDIEALLARSLNHQHSERVS